MILFVFEGGKAEPMVFDSIGELFLSKEELCVLKCEHDLPTLYSNLRANEYDLFRSLPFKENNIYLPEDKRLDTLFSQIFLFFDYDFQNRLGTQKVNGILDEMLDFFSDETENGKLYINYPMIESLKYTKEIPDANYRRYVATRKNVPATSLRVMQSVSHIQKPRLFVLSILLKPRGKRLLTIGKS